MLMNIVMLDDMTSAPTGSHGNISVAANATLDAGLHQIVVEYFNAFFGGAVVVLSITEEATSTDVSSSFMHDPAGPCNADCSMCNTAQQFCMACKVPGQMPVGGVCPSPLSVTP